MSKVYKHKIHCGGIFTISKQNDNVLVFKQAEFSHLTFSPDDYDSNREEMWKDIMNLQKTLLQTGNMVRVRQEEQLVIVEWTHNNYEKYFGGTYLEFLTEDEMELVDAYRQEDSGAIRDALKPELLENDEN